MHISILKEKFLTLRIEITDTEHMIADWQNEDSRSNRKV